MKLLSSVGILLFATTLQLPSSALAKKFQAPPMPAGYDDPGPLPENVLQVLVGELRKKLNDPYSIRDFSLCQSRAMHAMEALSPTLPWRRAYWVVHFKLNAKNAYGGYTGLQAGLVTISQSKVERISLIGTPIDDGPPKDAREPCQSIADEQIQQMLKQYGRENTGPCRVVRQGQRHSS